MKTHTVESVNPYTGLDPGWASNSDDNLSDLDYMSEPHEDDGDTVHSHNRVNYMSKPHEDDGDTDHSSDPEPPKLVDRNSDTASGASSQSESETESDGESANADRLRLVKVQGYDLSGEVSDNSVDCAVPDLVEKVKVNSKKFKSKIKTPAKGSARSMRKKMPDVVKGITHSEGEEAQVNQSNSDSEKKNEKTLSTEKPYKRALEFWNQTKVSKVFNIMRTVKTYRRHTRFRRVIVYFFYNNNSP